MVSATSTQAGDPPQSTILLALDGRARVSTANFLRAYSDTPPFPIACRYNLCVGNSAVTSHGRARLGPVSIRIMLAYGTFDRLFS